MNTTSFTSRRAFLGTMSAAAAATLVLPPRAFADGKPNSVFNGVRIGCITYSYRSMAKTAEETLKALLDDGLSETELMGGPIQDRSLALVVRPRSKDHVDAGTPPAPAADREAQLAKCRELRKMYNDAGRQHSHPQDGLRSVG